MDMLQIATDSLTERLLNAGMDVVPADHKINGRKELADAARKLARGVWTSQLSSEEAEKKIRQLAQFQFGETLSEPEVAKSA